ncbi:MAG: hypothetical protein ABIH59_02985 [archaeon]
MKSILDRIKGKYFSSWENAEEATQYFTLTITRLEKLSKLVETKRKAGTLKETQILRILEEEAEAEKQLKILRHNLTIFKRREKKGHPQIKITYKVKEIIRYAQDAENRWRKDIGYTADY